MPPIIVAILTAGAGMLLCFFGYRLFLVMLSVWGFFTGLWFGEDGMAIVFGPGFFSSVTGWVIGFVLGLAVALFSYLFYFLGVALVAAGFGASLPGGFLQALGFEPDFLTLVLVLSSAIMIAGLVLFLNLQKYVIVALTALGGANAVVLSILMLLGHVSEETLPLTGSALSFFLQDSWLWGVPWLILAIAGFAAQLRVNQDYIFTKNEYVQGWG